MKEERIPLTDDASVVAAWKAAVALGRKTEFGLFKQAVLSGAVLEICRQVVERGGRGFCLLSNASDAASLRVKVVVEGCPTSMLGGKGRDIHVGPALPAVKLHQVVETLEARPGGTGARLLLTIQQARASAKAARPAPPRAKAVVR